MRIKKEIVVLNSKPITVILLKSLNLVMLVLNEIMYCKRANSSESQRVKFPINGFITIITLLGRIKY